MSNPTVLTPPSFANFKFTVIGQQPELLKRISAPDPTSQYQYQPSPSPTSTPDQSESRERGSQQSHLLRPTLLEALAGDIDTGDAPIADATDKILVHNGTNNQTLDANPQPLDGTSASIHNSDISTFLPEPGLRSGGSHLNTSHSTTPPVEKKPSRTTNDQDHSAESKPQTPSSMPPPAAPSSAYDDPHIPTFLNITSSVLHTGRPSPVLNRSLSSTHEDSSQSRNFSEDSAHLKNTHATSPTQASSPITSASQPRPHSHLYYLPELESSCSALRSVQDRLHTLSKLATPASTKPAQAQTLLLVQSAHTQSATALSMALRAYNLAQQSLMSAQESLSAARECLEAAEDARTRAKEATHAAEKLNTEVETTALEWKQVISGLQGDLKDLDATIEKERKEEIRKEKGMRDEEEDARDVDNTAIGPNRRLSQAQGLRNRSASVTSVEVERRREGEESNTKVNGMDVDGPNEGKAVRQEQEEQKGMQKEPEMRLQRETERKAEAVELQSARRTGGKPQEEQRIKVAQAEENENEARLIEEQKTKRQQVMMQKLRASEEAAAKIITEREAKKKQINGNMGTASTATVTTRQADPTLSPTMHTTTLHSQDGTPAKPVEKMVAKQNLAKVKPDNHRPSESVDEKSRLHSRGIKLDTTAQSMKLDTTPASSLRTTALGLRPQTDTTVESDRSILPLTKPPSPSGADGRAVSTAWKVDRPSASDPPPNSVSLAPVDRNDVKRSSKSTNGQTATAHQDRSRTDAAALSPIEKSQAMTLKHGGGIKGEVSKSIGPNVPSAPRALTQTSQPSLPAFLEPAATVSVYHQGRDLGKLPVTPMTSSDNLSPAAHALNLRHVMEAKGFDWENKFIGKPGPSETAKSAPHSKDPLSLSGPPQKSPTLSRPQKHRRPATPSDTSPVSVSPSQPVFPKHVKKRLSLAELKSRNRKNNDASAVNVSEPGQQWSNSAPVSGVNVSSSNIGARTDEVASPVPVERYTPGSRLDNAANVSHDNFSASRRTTRDVIRHDPAPGISDDSGRGTPPRTGDEASVDRFDVDKHGTYDAYTSGERRTRVGSDRPSAPSVRAYDHYSPEPNSAQRRIHRDLSPEDRPMPALTWRNYHPPSAVSVPESMQMHSPSAPRYFPGTKRSRDSDHAELPPAHRRWPEDMEHQHDRDREHPVAAHSLSPRSPSTDVQRRPQRGLPFERPAFDAQIEKSQSPEVIYLGRGESYRPSYDYPSRSQVQTSTTAYHEHAHSSSAPAFSSQSVQLDESRHDRRQPTEDDRPELLDRLSAMRQPAGYSGRGSNFAGSRPSRPFSKIRGGGRGSFHGALSQRISSHSLKDRLA